jgi:hypothetical protein
MSHDMDDDAVRVADEKAAHPPQFVRQRVDHKHTSPHCFGMKSVCVGDLDNQWW